MLKRILFILVLCCWGNMLFAQEKISFGRFGSVAVYAKTKNPSQVVLFVSGDGGWNKGVVDMANILADMDALVLGIDITRYLRNLERSSAQSLYPAADFEELSKYAQLKYGLADYRIPVLVGYSSGATLVYALLCQAPLNTFKGAVSLGFCPDLEIKKPLSHGDGLRWENAPKSKGYVFLPDSALSAPWAILIGKNDKVCDCAATEDFVRRIAEAKIYVLPDVGHGFAVERRWVPQFKQAFQYVTGGAPPAPATAADVSGLPLTEVPAAGPKGTSLAVHITGDGGYGTTDQGIATGLAAQGIPVVVLNSLKYFWQKKTPDRAGADLQLILRHYLALWKKERALLVGYSLGADVLPFMINRLDPDLKARIAAVVLLGPSPEADFEFHVADWVASAKHPGSFEVLPELEKLRGMRILCVYGDDDQESLARSLPAGLARTVPFKGGHRFGRNYRPILDEIQNELK